ncbi:MAG: PrgI family protein [Patescibacteria group bacterium]|nr:PrgI family protein [Patescibacteria group bacterium]
MRYKVPQFVDMEDRIIGPITMRQLIILGVGGILTYAAYMKMGGSWPIVAIPAGGGAIAFAFLKIQDMTLFRFALALTQYIVKPEKRVWIQNSDYIHPPKDLLKDVESKPAVDPSELKKKLYQKAKEYIGSMDGREESLVFDAFHSEAKHDETAGRILSNNIQQSDTKSIQDKVSAIKKVALAQTEPIAHESNKF